MLEIRQTETFRNWLFQLTDVKAAARIQARIDRFSLGNPGDTKSVGEGIHEMRIDHGPGYRVYYLRRGRIVVVLLCGGDKSTQERDIKRAKKLAGALKET
jgi:putative addiction module killer protein